MVADTKRRDLIHQDEDNGDNGGISMEEPDNNKTSFSFNPPLCGDIEITRRNRSQSLPNSENSEEVTTRRNRSQSLPNPENSPLQIIPSFRFYSFRSHIAQNPF